MFSGLGSISDLNQQFAQFTSNLTNLDSLQDSSIPEQHSANSFDEKTSVSLHSLQLANKKLTEELNSEKSLINDLKAYLGVKDEQLRSKDAEVVYLTKELNQAIELEQVAKRTLSEYVLQTDDKIKSLEDLVDRQSPKTDFGEMEVAKNKIKQLERQLAEAVSLQQTEVLVASNDACEDRHSEEFRSTARIQEEQIRVLKEKLATLEENILSQTNNYSGEITSANRCIEQLRCELCNSSDRFALQVTELNGRLLEKTTALEKLESDLQTYLNNIVELNEEKSVLLDRGAKAESRCAELEVSLSALQSSLVEEDNSNRSAANDTLAQLQELADTRARQVLEAEGKVNTLTEKLKDMMHRFAELKTKSATQTQQLEERIADITKLAQVKDSEILGLRLKMENSERSSSDTRLKVSELAERYGEAQREITRLRSVVEERLSEVTILTEQRDQSAAALATCETQREDLTLRLQQLEQQTATLHTAHDIALRELQRELVAQKKLADEQLAQLRAEVEAAQGRLRLEEDTAGNLDNYKKRAQLALKKANMANTTLSTEVQQLKTALEEATVRLMEAQSAAKVANEELAVLNDSIQSLRMEKNLLEVALNESQASKLACEQDYARRLFELQQQLESINAASLHREEKDGGVGISRLTHGDDIGEIVAASPAVVKRKPSMTLFVPGSISFPTTSDSDVVAGPFQQDGSSSLNGDSDSNSKSLLGGSSWAMVAAASESRLTSSHPSTSSLVVVDGDCIARSQQPNATTHDVVGSSGNNYITSATGDDAEVEPSDFRATPLSSDSLLFINQLQNQLESVRKELSHRGIELEAAHQQLQYEKDEKRALKNRVEELLAYLERTKQLREGPDSAINMEYLKNCVFKFMCSSDLSEKRRLYPVIATILKLTTQEMRDIEVSFQATEERENEFQNTISSIGSFAASSFGSLWGSS